MYRKDSVDKIQAVALIVLTLSASVLMLAAAHLCMTYRSPVYPAMYEVSISNDQDSFGL